jgi:hypothetical protein
LKEIVVKTEFEDLHPVFFLIFSTLGKSKNKGMRHLLVFMGTVGFLAFGSWIRTSEPHATFAGDQNASYFFCCTHQPLAAIENQETCISGLNSNGKNNLQKRLPHNAFSKRPSGSSQTAIIENNSYPFLTKGVDLFLLYHFAQSLWEVFRC